MTDSIPRSHEIIINKLRSGLLLKSQKYRHNFPNITPNCQCGAVQCITHIFFRCDIINIQRTSLFTLIRNNTELSNSLNSFTRIVDKSHFLLYGSPLLTSNSNIILIKAVAEFLFSISYLFL